MVSLIPNSTERPNRIKREPSLFLTISCLLLLCTYANAQKIKSKNEARLVVNTFLDKIESRYSADKAIVSQSKDDEHWPTIYQFLDEKHEFAVNVMDNGIIQSYADIALMERLLQRRSGQSRRVNGEERAWQIGNAFLNKGGFESTTFERANFKNLADQAGASDDRNNLADRYELCFAKTVPGEEGTLQDVFLTLDCVEGGVLLFTSGPEFRFDPPKSSIESDDAIRRFYQLFATRKEQLIEAGSIGLAKKYDWPGDLAIERAMKKGVIKGGDAVLGSTYGARLDSERVARLCWAVSLSGVYVAFDAENGEPVRCFEIKGENQTVVDPKVPRIAKKTWRYMPFSHDDRSAVITASGFLAVVGCLSVAIRIRKSTKNPPNQ